MYIVCMYVHVCTCMYVYMYMCAGIGSPIL